MRANWWYLWFSHDPVVFEDFPDSGVKRLSTLWRLLPYLVLVGLCLALYTPGLTTLPPLDRDEALFAQATRQMAESRDFVDIRYRGKRRAPTILAILICRHQDTAAAVLS